MAPRDFPAEPVVRRAGSSHSYLTFGEKDVSVDTAPPVAFASKGHTMLAPVLALLSCVLYCLNGELLQAMQLHSPATERHASPGVNLLLCHLGGLAFAPHFLLADGYDAPGSRSSGAISSMPCAGLSGSLASRPRLAALLFAVVLMAYNYAWLLSTHFVTASTTNAVFQSSAAMVYAVSIPLFGERVSSPRVLGVFLVVSGSLLAGGVIGTTGPEVSGGDGTTMAATSAGVCLALMAAGGQCIYQVFFRHLFGHLKHDPRFLAFFGAWVSVWHILVVLPALLAADLLGLEAFELPRGFHMVLGTLASATIASTVNALYLCLALWGSVMLLPCASALSVPLMVLLDATIHGIRPTLSEQLGHGLVLIAVLLIMDLGAFLLDSQKGRGVLSKRDIAEIEI